MGCCSFSLRQRQQRRSLRFEASGDVFRMPAKDHGYFGMLLQFLERIRPGRVQQPILCLRFIDPSCDQRLLDQAGDRVTDFSGAYAEFDRDMPRALKSEIADESSNTSKDYPLCIRQQIVAPIQCRLEGPMPCNRGPMA